MPCDPCTAVFYLHRLTADDIDQRGHVSAEAKFAGAVLQIQCHVNSSAVLLLGEQQLTVPDFHSVVGAGTQCRICVVDSAQLYQMPVQVQIAAAVQVVGQDKAADHHRNCSRVCP